MEIIIIYLVKQRCQKFQTKLFIPNSMFYRKTTVDRLFVLMNFIYAKFRDTDHSPKLVFARKKKAIKGI